MYCVYTQVIILSIIVMGAQLVSSIEPELATEDPGLQGKGQISVYTSDYQVFIGVVWYCNLLSGVNKSDLRILTYVRM